MPARTLPGRFISASSKLGAAAGIVCLTALLSGCPSASNPTQGPQSTPGSAGIPSPMPGGMPAPTPGGAPGGMPGGSPTGMPDGSPDGATDGSADGSMDGSSGGGTGGTASSGGQSGSPGGIGDTQGVPGGMGSPGGLGENGPQGSPGGSGTAGGNGGGPLTPGEQVAILDAELDRGAEDFDTMILDTQEEQREERRGEPGLPPGGGGSGDSGSAPGPGSDVAVYEPEVYDIPDTPTSAGRPAPQNTAKYPPPADIPSGDDDDVVARQLRELAMSEPDPAVRERLWEEYRKYKGID